MSLGATVGELHFGHTCGESYTLLRLLVQEDGHCNTQEAFGYMLQNPNIYTGIFIYV